MESSLSDTAFTVSDDGYVRLMYEGVKRMALEHLISGFDEDMPMDASMGAVVTDITGYTEWMTQTQPAITLGWDWQLNIKDMPMQIVRVSEPRRNIMLLDSSKCDLGFAKTSALLEVFIDSFDWQSAVQKHLHIDYID